MEVTAGELPYVVRLATTRQPAGEDEATLAPGETVVLRSDDVDWGETIDGRLEYTAGDGSGTTFVDELDHFDFTRPSKEDCDAIRNPPPPEPVPPSAGDGGAPGSGSAGAGSTAAAPTASGAAETPVGPRESGAAAAPTAERTGGSGSGAVAAGDSVTLRGTGFLPGEQVAVRLHDSGAVLGTVTAAADGTVDAEVRIPSDTDAGPATLDLVGAESALVADVRLQVAGSGSPLAGDGGAPVVPLVAAAGTLVAAAAAFVSVTGRQRAGRRHTPVHG